MQNRTPVARAARPALPEFAPVPRKYRHDGWTPERQRAFIEALADTGSVTRAAGMVNIAQRNAYALRRSPGAEEFRRAWDAALDFGVARLKDIAFERAVEGELIPVFASGKLMGYRRKRNDALLMFCLRHYGQDAGGRRTTINYFSTKATAGAVAGEGGAAAASASTTMRVVSGERASAETLALRDDALAGELGRFDGVQLDETAAAAIAAALEECAARAREAEAAIDAGGDAGLDALADDPAEAFVATPRAFLGTLELGVADAEEPVIAGDEGRWQLTGTDKPEWLVRMEDRVAAGLPALEPESAEDACRGEAEARARAGQSRELDWVTKTMLDSGKAVMLDGRMLAKADYLAAREAAWDAEVRAAGDAAVAALRAERPALAVKADDGIAAVKRPRRRRKAS